MHAVISRATSRTGHMGEDGWSDGLWNWGSLLLVAWLALAVVVTWLLVRSVNNRAAAAQESSGAERVGAVLAERYAKREISSEEYSKRLAQLN